MATKEAENKGHKNSSNFQVDPFPLGANKCIFPAKYNDKNPKLANAIEEWPLGKLFNPSCTTLISPVQNSICGCPSPVGKHL